MKISVRGEIVDRKDKGGVGREIVVRDKGELDKLPFDKYPITHGIKPAGARALLTDGNMDCEASLHRYPKDSRYGEHIYIGSASRRLGSKKYAKEFRTFLERLGIVDEGISVSLEFGQDDRVDVSKVS